MIGSLIPITQYCVLAAGFLFLMWLIIIQIRYQDRDCSAINIQKYVYQANRSTSSAIDRRLKLHHITVLGTHNSYHKYNLLYKYEHRALENQFEFGIRQIELDIHIMRDDLLIYHLQLFDDRTTCYCFKDCLMRIARWSEQHRAHYPIFLFIEIKEMFYEDLMTGLSGGVKCQHFQQIKDEILQVFSSNIFILPGDVQGNYSSIRLALKKQKQNEMSNDYTSYNYGWPSVSQSLGRILPVFLDDVRNRARDLYSTCQSLREFFFISQRKSDLPYSSILTTTNVETDRADLVNGAMNGQMTRILLGYGHQNIERKYELSKQYQINFLSSDSVYCNDTPLCLAIANDFQSSSIVCNQYSAPLFCNSSSLTSI